MTASSPFKRINAQPGLMVDVDVWRDAHDYHREQLHLHHLALHGWGIVSGLDVTIADNAENTLRIEPGLAIDPTGNFIVVSGRQNYRITTKEKELTFLVLQFREVLSDPSAPTEDNRATHPTRVLEAYRIQERDRPPDEPYLELARIERDPGSGPIKMPHNPDKPKVNELDLRSRVTLGTATLPFVLPPSAAPAAEQKGGGETERPPESNGAAVEQLTQEFLTLAPRVDGLRDELHTLQQQVSALTLQVETSVQRPAAAQPSVIDVAPIVVAAADAAAGNAAQQPDPRLDVLARQVEALAEQVRAVGQSASEPRQSVTPEQVEAMANQVAALAQQVGAVQQDRTDTLTPLQQMGERVDSVRNEMDAIGIQLQSLSRRVELAPPPAVVQVPEANGSAPRGTLNLAVGEHSGNGWDSHQSGLRYLAREISAWTDFQGRPTDPVTPVDPRETDVLVLAGHGALSLDDSEVEGLSRHLEKGGVVLGEGCAGGPNGENGAREFAMSFVDLGNRLGRRLTKVDRWHPLMSARHVFGEPPSGGRANARLLEADGMVYSDADYGCAWQGGSAEKPMARGAIRDALEFGVNLAVYRRGGS